jgi:hypothetical protein
MNEAEEKPNLYYIWPEFIFEKMGPENLLIFKTEKKMYI